MTGFDLRRLQRYGILGVAINGSAYLVFAGLIAARVPPVAANAICYGLAIGLSYLGNRMWTFESASRHGADLPKFAVAYGLGLLCSVGTMAVLVSFMPALIAQIVTMVPTALLIFAALNLLGFGRSQTGTGGSDASCG